MRMAELAEASGVPRETIHFYLREGLLPRPQKGGRTTAFYGAEHVDRLRTIRRLREEKYLPLAVIRRLLDAPGAAAERDLEALSEVLQLDPTIRREPSGPISPKAREEALARGLLGPRAPVAGEPDSADARVLAIVEEAARLSPDARALTLADLEACAAGLSSLVAREAAIFFDAVLATGDAQGTIAALRAGRPSVARFVAAFRDLMLRRIVTDLVLAVQRAPELVLRSAAVSISDRTASSLGAPERREALRSAVVEARGARGTAAALAFHLFACGATGDLAELTRPIAEAGGREVEVLVAWARCEASRSRDAVRALEDAAAATPGFALGEVLAGEVALTRALRRRAPGESLLDEAVPSLARLLGADPERDAPIEARVLGLLHRGRVEVALPAVLGRGARGRATLERALAAIEGREGEALEPLARARVAVNARLFLGRHHLVDGRVDEARREFEQAIAVDPDGPIAAAVRAELAT
jgi:DNA-binding transcriptional MerR regulator